MLEAFEETVLGLSTLSIVIRLGLASLAGCAIGYDRNIRNNNAGVRTHALVCLASALTMAVSQFIAMRFPEYSIDVSRIGSGVVGGVGFLGAGTIIVTRGNRVHGLTNAAGVWACSCLGLAFGMGYIDGGIVATLLMLFIMRVLSRLDHKLRHHTSNFDLYVEFETHEAIREFTESMREQYVRFYDLRLQKGRGENDGPVATMSIELPSSDYRSQFQRRLKEIKGVRYFELI
ncbi:MAG: MgtC/SapB family protein [Atopobiaceae bacterium]|nr:MgtC/SapB family protein [Atopobiaceae bacterium]